MVLKMSLVGSSLYVKLREDGVSFYLVTVSLLSRFLPEAFSSLPQIAVSLPPASFSLSPIETSLHSPSVAHAQSKQQKKGHFYNATFSICISLSRGL